MALEKHSKIYYDFQITADNKYLDLSDSQDLYAIELNVGSYTPTELAKHVQSKINEVASDEFTVTFNRADRMFTITSEDVFEMLFATGSNASRSCAFVLGFPAEDQLGGDNYTSYYSAGKVYSTQFYIQSYKPTKQNRKAIDGVVNKSASGKVEVVKYGNERFLDGEFLFITDIVQMEPSIIRSNPNGVQDYLSLIEWLVEKSPVEIMIDESKPEEFQTFILESTEQDSKGLDYELIELYDRGLPLYYRSGKLKFKLME